MARARWAELGLAFVGVVGFWAALRAGLPFWRAYGLVLGGVALILAPLSLHQFRTLDEYSRGRWLRSMGVSALVTLTLLLLSVAWGFWTETALAPGLLLGLFIAGLASGWLTSLWLTLRDRRA